VTIAYLDPGSGSLIVSAVVGGAAGAAVAVKHARARVTGVFRRKGKQANTDGQVPDGAAGRAASPDPAASARAEAVAPRVSA
jgi:hypothetical protein